MELCTTYSSNSPVVTTTSIILCFNKHRLTQVHLENGRERGWLADNELFTVSNFAREFSPNHL